MSDMVTFKTNSDTETKQLAKALAAVLSKGNVVTLEGDLGAGKTTFTKGFAEGLGVKRTVNSPTFTIIKEYRGEMPLYHMDVYRLENSDEDIGFDEYFNGEGISIVEWAHFIEDFLPEELLTIYIRFVDEQTRLLEFKAIGMYYEQKLDEFKSNVTESYK